MMPASRGRASGRRSRRGSRGQALAEFALVAPLFFLLLLAIMEGARYVFYHEMLSFATREGARYAIVHGHRAIDLLPSGPNPPNVAANTTDPCNSDPCPGDPDGDSNVAQVVRDRAFSLAGPGTITFQWPMWATNNGRGETVTVAVEYTYAPLVPILPPITVVAESSLVINN